MVSPELLRHFPFFGFMDDRQLKSVALISHEVTFNKDEVILENARTANALYFIIDGSVSLYYVSTTENDPSYYMEYYVGDIDPGDIFGISALIEPYIYTGTMRVSKSCRVIKIDASALRALCSVDAKLGYGLMREVAMAVMQRLHYTRILLISAR